MDIPRLRAFLYAVELGSVSRAASRLRTAQSALSRQIRKLEEELGVQLLVREGRGVRPTEAGEALVRRGEWLLQQIQATAEEVQAHEGRPSGTVTLALPPGAAKTLGPQLVMRYRERCPNVTLRLRSGLSGFIRQWLAEGSLDAALLHDPPRIPDVVIRPLIDEDQYLIAPSAANVARLPRGLRALPRRFQLAELARLPLILPSRPHGLRALLDSLAARERITLDVLEVDNLELIKTLVESGAGFSVMAFNAAQLEVKRRVLRAVPLEPTVSWQLALAMPKRQPTRATVELVKLLEELIVEMVARGVWRGRLAGDTGAD